MYMTSEDFYNLLEHLNIFFKNTVFDDNPILNIMGREEASNNYKVTNTLDTIRDLLKSALPDFTKLESYINNYSFSFDLHSVLYSPFDDLPLYITDDNQKIRYLATWRLRYQKNKGLPVELTTLEG